MENLKRRKRKDNPNGGKGKKIAKAEKERKFQSD
jgi:hypothetical protein